LPIKRNGILTTNKLEYKMNFLKTKLTALILVVVLIGLLCGCAGHSEPKDVNKDIKESKIEIVTPVSIDTIKGNMPSYCNPKAYKISFVNGYYVARLPYGTEIGCYDTIEEAQEAINENVKDSRERWNKYGGF